MCHADAQHRATSDPSEGHTVETGEREADMLGIANGDVEGAVVVCSCASLGFELVVVLRIVRRADDDLVLLTGINLILGSNRAFA